MADARTEIQKTPPILIAGAARSGTILTAGIIQRLGAFGGITDPPSRWNPRGMFENTAVREGLEKPCLRSLGVDPLGQRPLPVTRNASVPQKASARWRERVHEVFLSQGYPGGPWYYKGAKACLLWPLWHAAFPDARWLVVRRRAGDIAASCLRTGFMRAFRDASGWLEWVAAHEEKFREMAEAGLALREIHPQQMIDGDFSQMREAAQWLGLPWNEDAARGFVDPALWRGAKPKRR